MNRVLDGYCRLLEWLLVGLLATMVALVFGNVVMRYVLNSGITLSEELSRWLFVWMTFLGAIVAMRERAHLGTDVLVSRLGPRGRRVCLVAGQLLMLYATWLLLSGAWTQARINVEVEAPVTGLSMAIFYAAGVVFAVSTGLLIVLDLWRNLSGQLADDELRMVQESEDLAQVEALRIDQTPPLGQGPHSMPFRR
ncbi:TRAP transporter small permease [Ideonella sp. DXS29W]|uniref:TRAP transporter small permease protein n=1 Tax=Ideonella lacteola TaxID=2984193 RepID=A0ABU9BUE7_9BURK